MIIFYKYDFNVCLNCCKLGSIIQNVRQGEHIGFFQRNVVLVYYRHSVNLLVSARFKAAFGLDGTFCRLHIAKASTPADIIYQPEHIFVKVCMLSWRNRLVGFCSV